LLFSGSPGPNPYLADKVSSRRLRLHLVRNAAEHPDPVQPSSPPPAAPLSSFSGDISSRGLEPGRKA
ncbi:unnamed protein product, partial [Urochloa humidicola]